MKVTRCWSGTNGWRARALCAGIVLLAAGGMVLRWSSRASSGQGGSTSVRNPDPQDRTISSRLRAAPSQISKERAVAAFSRLPLMFEPNAGQANPGQSDSSAEFLARGAGYSILLDRDSAVIGLQRGKASTGQSGWLRMKLAGASASARVTGTDLLPGKTNYFIGNDPAQWHKNVSQFARVRYENIYPGINLLFYGNQGRLEYDFQVAPGADPSQAELEFDGSKLELADGDVIAKTGSASVRLEAPRVYQQIGGRQEPIQGRFVMRAANRVGFEIGVYDHSRELIIDPVLTYSTYFGGSGDESSPSVAVDSTGNIYLAGSTTSSNLPVTAGSYQGTLHGAQNIFILKLNPLAATTGIESLTYLGGSGTDSSVGIAVDGGGNAYVAGTTSSTDFPTTPTTAYQSNPKAGSNGTSHVFVSVLNATLSTLKYSSYLSGNHTDIASGMAIDNKGNLFVTGTTTSTDTGGVTVGDQFPASGPPQAEPFQNFSRATNQFFVTKVNTVASGIGSIAYSTYFGGGTPTGGTAQGGGIAVDSTGNIYFTGTTNFIYTGSSPTTDFPILNAYQPCLDAAPPATHTTPDTCTNTSVTNTDAFIAKLKPSAAPGSQLVWSTYFGGGQTDSGTGIALDSGAANVYITGTTNSPDITQPSTLAPFQKCLNVPPNPNNPTSCPAPTAPTDAYVARLNNPASGNMALTYFSYLGGTADEAGLGIAVDTANGALLTGWTQSADLPIFPTAGVIQGTLKGSQDAFFARINTTTVTGQNNLGAYVTYFGGSAVDRGTSITLDTNLNTYLAGDTTSSDLQTQAPLQANLNGPSDAFVVKLGTSADLCITCTAPTVSPAVVSAGSQVTFTYTITNVGPDLATNIQFTDNWTGQPLTFVSAGVGVSSGSCSSSGSTASCTIASLQSGSTATVKVVMTVTSAGNFNGGTAAVSSTQSDPLPSNNQTSVGAQATDFTVAVSPANQTIGAAGQTAVYTVTLTPSPSFASSISLSCSSNVPSQAACNFTTNPVTLSAGPGTSTLNLTTTARPVTTASLGSWTRPFYAIWLVIPGMVLFGYGAGSGRRRRRIAGMLLVCVLGMLILLQPACSKSSTTTPTGGTPAGTYNIVLTATSGSFSRNANFTLTVP